MDQNTPDPLTAETLSLEVWHARFCQQAGWTRDLRQYLYGRAGLSEARRVLEVGCGTGVVVADLATSSPAAVHGLDLSQRHLRFARRQGVAAQFACGEALALPYANGVFDFTCCHFLLLWVMQPELALAQMRRVTRKGGVVLALAEPDYGGRIDYPPELAALGQWQRDALRRQGADPEIGRKLGSLFRRAGLQAVETGLLGGQWGPPPSSEARASEWAVLQADLGLTVSLETLQHLQALDDTAWQRGERVLFVPTFYAWGRVS